MPVTSNYIFEELVWTLMKREVSLDQKTERERGRWSGVKKNEGERQGMKDKRKAMSTG